MDERRTRYGLSGLTFQPPGNVTAAIYSPPRGPEPRRQPTIHGCALGLGGSVPAGSAAIVTIRAGIGALRCARRVGLLYSQSVSTCTACPVGRSDRLSGVNKKESRTSLLIIEARQGSTTVETPAAPEIPGASKNSRRVTDTTNTRRNFAYAKGIVVSRFTETMYRNARWSLKGMVTGEPHAPARQTWAEVHERARRVAGGLAAAGIGHGDAVAVLAGSPVEIAATAQGIWMRGASLTMADGHRHRPGARLKDAAVIIIGESRRHRPSTSAAPVSVLGMTAYRRKRLPRSTGPSAPATTTWR